MLKNFEVLLAKNHKTLTEHLRQAAELGEVSTVYRPAGGHRKHEKPGQYAQRLVRELKCYQFAHVIFNGESHYVAFGVAGPIITQYGKFTVVPAQVVGGRWGWHYFLFYSDVEKVRQEKEVLLRLDSGCLTGQLFGDVTCDCKEQLEIAMQQCAAQGGGVVVSIPGHDGRGWGEFKMANQLLMDEFGLDTVEAARLFYGDEAAIDQRTYTEAVVMLRAFGFNEEHQFKLATNNPRKIGALAAYGLQVKTVASVVPERMNAKLKKNLLAKSKQWGHDFSQRKPATI